MLPEIATATFVRVSTWPESLAACPARVVGRPLLALSDVRGDLDALEAVLDEIKSIELCGIVAAGDHCLGGAHPFEVWQRLNALGATLVRGVTDLALGALAIDGVTPRDPDMEERFEVFLETQQALGDIVCRRLAELPSTAVVSLDDRSGVMVLHGSPRDEHRALEKLADDEDLDDATSCVAEDVLVVGRGADGFVRKLPRLLVIGAGSVSRNAAQGPHGQRTAHAVLLAPCTDGIVRAFPRDIAVKDRDERGGTSLRRSAS